VQQENIVNATDFSIFKTLNVITSWPMRR